MANEFIVGKQDDPQVPKKEVEAVSPHYLCQITPFNERSVDLGLDCKLEFLVDVLKCRESYLVLWEGLWVVVGLVRKTSDVFLNHCWQFEDSEGRIHVVDSL